MRYKTPKSVDVDYQLLNVSMDFIHLMLIKLNEYFFYF